jgi:hypothetical protein
MATRWIARPRARVAARRGGTASSIRVLASDLQPLYWSRTAWQRADASLAAGVQRFVFTTPTPRWGAILRRLRRSGYLQLVLMGHHTMSNAAWPPSSD